MGAGRVVLQKLHYPAAVTAGLCTVQEGGGVALEWGWGTGNTGVVEAGCATTGSWASLSSCVQNVLVARVLLVGAELS